MFQFVQRSLGKTGFSVSPIGFGAFKIGRNEKVKYPTPYDLPDDVTAERFLNEVLDLGINHIDTAPAYGVSEERIGKFLTHRRAEFFLSTKVGEIFEGGVSRYDFSAPGVEQSLHRSLQRLRTDVVDLVLIHAPAEDLAVLEETEVVTTLQRAKEEGLTRLIGFSAKSIVAAQLALEWSDVLMVEYHLADQTFEEVIHQAAARGVGIIVKKGLGAGHLSAESAIPFVLNQAGISNLIVGSLNVEHLKDDLQIALKAE